eukprot:494809_1
MEVLLQLTSDIKMLTDDEFQLFVQSFDRDSFTQIIFAYFNHEIKSCQDIEKYNNQIIPSIEKTSDRIVEIIRSREKAEQAGSFVKLDKLPNAMISKISSFLDFDSTLDFEQCNKSIFIGTRSPIALYTMKYFYSYLYYTNNSSNNSLQTWNRFKSIKELSFKASDFYDWDNDREMFVYEFADKSEYEGYYDDSDDEKKMYYLFDLPIWNNLQTLTVTVETGYDHCELGTDCPLEEFIHDFSKCNLSNISTFRFISSEYIEKKDFNDFLQFVVDSFPNIEFIEINSRGRFNEQIMMNDINWTNNLKGISFKSPYSHNTGFCKILSNISDQLQSYHHGGYREKIHGNVDIHGIDLRRMLLLASKNNTHSFLKDIYFPNLKELCITSPTKPDIDIFVHQNLKHLQRIYVDVSAKKFDTIKADHEATLQLLFFNTIKSLSYIAIKANEKNIHIMLKILQNSLKIDKKK